MYIHTDSIVGQSVILIQELPKWGFCSEVCKENKLEDVSLVCQHNQASVKAVEVVFHHEGEKNMRREHNITICTPITPEIELLKQVQLLFILLSRVFPVQQKTSTTFAKAIAKVLCTSCGLYQLHVPLLFH